MDRRWGGGWFGSVRENRNLGRQGEYSQWSPLVGTLVFLYSYFISYIHSFLCLIFLHFLHHVFSKTFCADLRSSESEGQQGPSDVIRVRFCTQAVWVACHLATFRVQA